MKGWNAGKWVAPADRYRESGRQPVHIPGWYIRLLGFALLAGLVFAAILILLALFGVRPR